MTEYIDQVYGHTLSDLGNEFHELVVIDADLQRATETYYFRDNFPDRYLDVGIQEANMVGIAAGLALSGKTVFCGTFACFVSQRALDQIAISVAYCDANVKLIGVEAALASGRNGASHQGMLDLTIFRAMPNMTVIVPADAIETKQVMTYLVEEHKGPAYIRIQRGKVPVIFDESNFRFRYGKAYKVSEGNDLTIIATGIMVPRAIEAVEVLENEGIEARLLNMSTVKPIDEESIITAAAETGAIVVAENHTIYGGLGGAVAEIVTESDPVPVRRVGIQDSFGEVGTLDYLSEKYGLTTGDIVQAAHDVLAKKEYV